MKILIIIGIIAFIAFTVWIAKRNGVTTEYQSKQIEILTNLDEPIDFGYKTVWIAVKTDKKERIAEILELKSIEASNWKSGIESGYNDGIFITPLIGQWTLAVGVKLSNGQLEDINKLENILNKLSSEFGEAQSFGSHRVVEYHHWIKSINGKITRTYSYIGESGENLKVFGELTEPEEIGLNLFNSLSKEAESDKYWEREDLDYADEELVMKIAENWSVNPTKLTERKDIKKELGLIGK